MTSPSSSADPKPLLQDDALAQTTELTGIKPSTFDNEQFYTVDDAISSMNAH